MLSNKVSGRLGSIFIMRFPLNTAIHKLPSVSMAIPSGIPATLFFSRVNIDLPFAET